MPQLDFGPYLAEFFWLVFSFFIFFYLFLKFILPQIYTVLKYKTEKLYKFNKKFRFDKKRSRRRIRQLFRKLNYRDFSKLRYQFINLFEGMFSKFFKTNAIIPNTKLQMSTENLHNNLIEILNFIENDDK
jgi:hypothetical protein